MQQTYSLEGHWFSKSKKKKKVISFIDYKTNKYRFCNITVVLV